MKGILFKNEMVRAIVEGRKTVTRRLLNPQPYQYQGRWVWAYKKGMLTTEGFWTDHSHYLPGEVIYIKEAWGTEPRFDNFKPRDIPDGAMIGYNKKGNVDNFYFTTGKTRSPLFMSEWAARYFLKIVSVRPERLNDITPADCVAEGINDDRAFWDDADKINRYRKLWDSINKKTPWVSNSFVWRIEFERVERP